MNHRGIVAVILASSVGGALMIALAFTLGPWTPEPQENVALELLGLIAAGLGALSVYIGMTVMSEAKESATADPYSDDTPEHDGDPEAESDDDQNPA